MMDDLFVDDRDYALGDTIQGGDVLVCHASGQQGQRGASAVVCPVLLRKMAKMSWIPPYERAPRDGIGCLRDRAEEAAEADGPAVSVNEFANPNGQGMCVVDEDPSVEVAWGLNEFVAFDHSHVRLEHGLVDVRGLRDVLVDLPDP